MPFLLHPSNLPEIWTGTRYAGLHALGRDFMFYQVALSEAALNLACLII